MEYATLEFIKTADHYRDIVMADGVITPEEEKYVIKALQALARVKKLEAWIDSY